MSILAWSYWISLFTMYASLDTLAFSTTTYFLIWIVMVVASDFWCKSYSTWSKTWCEGGNGRHIWNTRPDAGSSESSSSFHHKCTIIRFAFPVAMTQEGWWLRIKMLFLLLLISLGYGQMLVDLLLTTLIKKGDCDTKVSSLQSFLIDLY